MLRKYPLTGEDSGYTKANGKRCPVRTS